jgi:hypothetical protein
MIAHGSNFMLSAVRHSGEQCIATVQTGLADKGV